MTIAFEEPELIAANEPLRAEKLQSLPYCMMVEGEHRELENFESWIRETLQEPVNLIYHGKTGYNLGFAEYFFATDGSMQQALRIVPRIYSLYYNAPHTGRGVPLRWLRQLGNY